MLTDKFGREFHYLDYITYVRDGTLALAKIDRIVISNNNRLVCVTDSDCYVNKTCKVTLKKFETIEIIPETKASEWFPDVYKMICGYR